MGLFSSSKSSTTDNTLVGTLTPSLTPVNGFATSQAINAKTIYADQDLRNVSNSNIGLTGYDALHLAGIIGSNNVEVSRI